MVTLSTAVALVMYGFALAVALWYRWSYDEQRRGNAEDALIPEWVDFRAIEGLSTEAKERLSRARPRSLGQAARIHKVTPAAVSLLAGHIRAGRD